MAFSCAPTRCVQSSGLPALGPKLSSRSCNPNTRVSFRFQVRAVSPRAVKGPAHRVQSVNGGTEMGTQVWLALGASRIWPQGSPHFIREETELLGGGMACLKLLWYNKKKGHCSPVPLSRTLLCVSSSSGCSPVSFVILFIINQQM